MLDLNHLSMEQIGQLVDELSPGNVVDTWEHLTDTQNVAQWAKAACCYYAWFKMGEENRSHMADAMGVTLATVQMNANTFDFFYNAEDGTLECFPDRSFSDHCNTARYNRFQDKEEVVGLLEEAEEKGWSSGELKERLQTGREPTSDEAKVDNLLLRWWRKDPQWLADRVRTTAQERNINLDKLITLITGKEVSEHLKPSDEVANRDLEFDDVEIPIKIMPKR